MKWLKTGLHDYIWLRKVISSEIAASKSISSEQLSVYNVAFDDKLRYSRMQ
jgi:hypothetical protein